MARLAAPAPPFGDPRLAAPRRQDGPRAAPVGLCCRRRRWRGAAGGDGEFDVAAPPPANAPPAASRDRRADLNLGGRLPCPTSLMPPLPCDDGQFTAAVVLPPPSYLLLIGVSAVRISSKLNWEYLLYVFVHLSVCFDR